jgi:HEAT repeat protein
MLVLGWAELLVAVFIVAVAAFLLYRVLSRPSASPQRDNIPRSSLYNIPPSSEPVSRPQTLVSLLRHSDHRAAASKGLALIGAPAVPFLLPALKDENPEVRSMAAATFEDMGPSATTAIDALVEAMLTDSHENVSLHAAGALAAIGEPARHVLLDVLRGHHPCFLYSDRARTNRWLALKALLRLAPNDASIVSAVAHESEALFWVQLMRRELLSSYPDRQLVESAAQVLCSLGPPVVPLILQYLLLESRLRDQRQRIHEILGRMGHACVPRLIASAKGELLPPDDQATSATTELFRAAGARALGVAAFASSIEAVACLADALKDSSGLVREAAASALAELGPAAEPAVPALISLIVGGDRSAACTHAVMVLSKVGLPARAAAVLETLSRDPHFSSAATKALRDIGEAPSGPER